MAATWVMGSNVVSELLGGVLVASIAAIGTYIAAARKLSGKIGTSEAGQLWQESASMRDDYRTRIASSDQRIVSLEERVAMLEKANNELAHQNFELVAANSQLEITIASLRTRVDVLDRENATLQTELTALRKRSENA
jgi:chromosome segregation ATPase